MSDINRYLPLSHGRSADESGVTGDWSTRFPECLEAIASLLDSAQEVRWDQPAGPLERPVSDLVAELVDRVGRGAPDAADPRSRVDQDFAGNPDPMTPVAAVSALRDLARRFRQPRAESSGIAGWLTRSGTRRESLRSLTDLVVTGYDLAEALDRDIDFPAAVTGAVALARVSTAPSDIRSVVRGRTIVADDARWSFGHGPELRGTAAAIVRFLFERGGVPG